MIQHSRIAAVVSGLLMAAFLVGCAAGTSPGPGAERQVSGTVAYDSKNELDHRPLDPAIDPDIDLFFGDWRQSIPFNTHGTLTERAILSPLGDGGDILHPPTRGAVLVHLKRLSRATLEPRSSTEKVTLSGEQEIIYITGGKGIIATSAQLVLLSPGMTVLVPEGLEFRIRNTETDPLEMIVMVEPTPEGFRPNHKLIARDARALPWRDQGTIMGHWAHNGKNLLKTPDGLGTLESVVEFTFDPMTIGQPHSINPGMEVVMISLEGDFLVLLGKELRWLKQGQAYLVPPTGFTAFGNQNPTNEPMKMLFVARFKDHDPRP